MSLLFSFLRELLQVLVEGLLDWRTRNPDRATVLKPTAQDIADSNRILSEYRRVTQPPPQ